MRPLTALIFLVLVVFLVAPCLSSAPAAITVLDRNVEVGHALLGPVIPLKGGTEREDNTLLQVFERARYAALRGGISAFLAGALEVIALMWLRTTVNYQYRYGVALNVAIMDLYKQGGVRRFYRGLPYALLQGPLSKFGSVAANEAAVVFAKFMSSQPSSSLSSALGSVLAGLWRMLLMPIDTYKTISQVDGAKGIVTLGQRLMKGDIAALYSGVTATVLMAAFSHYPWFLVHNFMEQSIMKAKTTRLLLLRSALIGFCSTAVADTVSNFMRVIKTVKQATAGEQMGHVSYISIIEKIYSESGLVGLFGRGLKTRILTDGIQSMLFTVLWKLIARSRAGHSGQIPSDVDGTGINNSINRSSSSIKNSSDSSNSSGGNSSKDL